MIDSTIRQVRISRQPVQIHVEAFRIGPAKCITCGAAVWTRIGADGQMSFTADVGPEFCPLCQPQAAGDGR